MSDDVRQFLPAWPKSFNLCEYFLDHNLKAGRGQKTALICGSEQRSYAQISDAAKRVAAALRRAGHRPEERVLILLPDCFEFAEVFFGILRAGGVFAMVNPLLKSQDLAYYLRYTKARCVFAHADCLAELAPVAAEEPLCETVFVVGAKGETPQSGSNTPRYIDYAEALAAEDPAGESAAMAPTGPDDLAGWLFTSGSTGKPKACVHTHAHFAYSTETYALRVAGYREDDICLSVPKLFFGYATGTNLMFPFRVGATSLLFPGRSTADELFDQIEAHRPTFLTNVPTLINNMLRSERIQSADLSCLRISLSAGEALPAALYHEWMDRVGIEILDGIGSAEMFHIYISNAPGDVRLGSLGRLVPGYEAQIIDPNDKPLGVGEAGRLRVRGGSTALCYWADEPKSRETFQADWCTSQDVFRCDEEGYFYYEGRSDDLLKVSGIWVSPLEIENALLDHEAVAEVCVLGREDEQQLVKPVAYVVPVGGREGDESLAAELKAYLKGRLAPYKYPRWFEWRSELPKNDRGKVARKLLRQETPA